MVEETNRDKLTNNELAIMLDNISCKVSEGFKGIHERQDRTNGNVARNTDFRLQATGSITALKWVIGVIGFGNLAILIKLFVWKFLTGLEATLVGY